MSSKKNKLKKLAIFVEGQTEQLFVKRLVTEVFGQQQLVIVMKRGTGGSSAPKQETLRGSKVGTNPRFYILIYDCSSDNRVKSEILEHIVSLKNADYDLVLGMRDLYPLPYNELQQLHRGLNYMPKRLLYLKNMFEVLVTVQEMETWFLAEYKHYLKVDKRLTAHYIKQRLGFDPYSENMLYRHHPSADLDRIYKLAGKGYSKKYEQVERLVRRLDFYNLRTNLRYQIPTLDRMLFLLENFGK